MKCESIKGTSFIKLGLFFHKISFIIKTHFQTCVFLQRIFRYVMNLKTSITVPSNTTKCYSNMTTCFSLRRLSSDQHYKNFEVLLTVHLSIFISVINQLDAQNFCFTISLFHASKCFEHMCSSSGGQNCITQPLVSSH